MLVSGRFRAGDILAWSVRVRQGSGGGKEGNISLHMKGVLPQAVHHIQELASPECLVLHEKTLQEVKRVANV